MANMKLHQYYENTGNQFKCITIIGFAAFSFLQNGQKNLIHAFQDFGEPFDKTYGILQGKLKKSIWYYGSERFLMLCNLKSGLNFIRHN